MNIMKNALLLLMITNQCFASGEFEENIQEAVLNVQQQSIQRYADTETFKVRYKHNEEVLKLEAFNFFTKVEDVNIAAFYKDLKRFDNDLEIRDTQTLQYNRENLYAPISVPGTVRRASILGTTFGEISLHPTYIDLDSKPSKEFISKVNERACKEWGVNELVNVEELTFQQPFEIKRGNLGKIKLKLTTNHPFIFAIINYHYMYNQDLEKLLEGVNKYYSNSFKN